MIVTTDIDVFTGPEWLFNHFNEYTNPNGTAMIKPIIDPDGDPIIGTKVLDDPDWDFLDDVVLNGKLIREHLVIKKYKYEEVEI